MKIRMLKTTPGSVDGLHTTEFMKDQVYDMSKPQGALALANIFVNELEVAEVVAEDGGDGGDENASTNPDGSDPDKSNPDPQPNTGGDDTEPTPSETAETPTEENPEPEETTDPAADKNDGNKNSRRNRKGN